MFSTIVTLASVPAILAIVNLLKGLGLSGKWSALAAVVIGVALAVADYYLGHSGAYQAAVGGIVLGLGSSGLYDLGGATTATDAAAAVTNVQVGR